MPLVNFGKEARPKQAGVRLVRPGKSRVDRRAEIDINGTCGSGETKKTTRPDTVDAPAGISISILPLLWAACALQMRRRLANHTQCQVVDITR